MVADATFGDVNGEDAEGRGVGWDGGGVGMVVCWAAKDTCRGGIWVSDWCCCWLVGSSLSLPWKMRSSLLVRSVRLICDVDVVVERLLWKGGESCGDANV